MFKKILVTFFSVFFLISSTLSYAFVMPPLATPIGQEIASVMASRGVLSQIGRVLTGGGPYGMLASLLIPIAYNWITKPNGTVDVPAAFNSAAPIGSYWASSSSYATPPDTIVSGDNVESVGQLVIKYNEGSGFCDACTWSVDSVTPSGNNFFLSGHYSYKTSTYPRSILVRAGTNSNGTVTAPMPSGGSTENLSVSEAVQKLTLDQQSQPIPAQKIADAINAVLQDAASQPGGITFVPVTAAAVEASRAATGVTSKVGDLAKPIGFPDPSTVPNPTAPTVSASQAAATPTNFDFSVAPSNQTVPVTVVSATQNVTIFASSAGCPAPITFVMFKKTYSIDYIPACNLMATIYPFFMMCGAAAAAFIFFEGFKS